MIRRLTPPIITYILNRDLNIEEINLLKSFIIWQDRYCQLSIKQWELTKRWMKKPAKKHDIN